MQWLYRLADRVRHRARTRTVPAEQYLGALGEDLVHRYLRRQGFIVVARNFQPHGGRAEVDLVAWDEATLVFVEVKSGDGNHADLAARVGPDKREQIVRAAREWVRRADLSWDRVRFDIVTVVHGRRPTFTHLRGAF